MASYDLKKIVTVEFEVDAATANSAYTQVLRTLSGHASHLPSFYVSPIVKDVEGQKLSIYDNPLED